MSCPAYFGLQCSCWPAKSQRLALHYSTLASSNISGPSRISRPRNVAEFSRGGQGIWITLIELLILLSNARSARLSPEFPACAKKAERGCSSNRVGRTWEVLDIRTLSSPVAASNTKLHVLVLPWGNPVFRKSFTTIISSGPHGRNMLHFMSRGPAEGSRKPLEIKGTGLQHDATCWHRVNYPETPIGH